jgi:Galactose oxidase, central domain
VARNDGLAIAQLTYLDHRPDTDAVVFSGCQDNGTVRFTGDPAWYHVAPGDGGGVAIDPNDVRRVMRQGTYAHLETCTDGALSDELLSHGGSWRSLWIEKKFPPVPDTDTTMRDRESGNSEFYTRIRAVDAGAGVTLAAFGTNRLWATYDWGETWKTLPSNTNPLANPPGDFNMDKLDGNVVDIRLASATSIYVATKSFAYRFTQNNNAWGPRPPVPLCPTALTAGWTVSSIAVDNDARGSFYLGFSQTAASTDDDHVWYYDGTDWHATRPTSGTTIPNVPVNALAVDPANSNIVYVGTDVGVWKRTKQGGNAWTWEIFSQGLPEAAVLDLAIHPKARLLRAATHGRGAWEIAIDATTGRDIDVYLRAHNADSGRRFPWAQNVPDPAAPGGYFYESRSASPDIRVRRSSKPAPASPVDFVGFADLDLNASTLDATGINKILVEVHNRGWKTAPKDKVSACLLLAPADAGVPALPADFATRIANRDRTNWLGSSWKFANPALPYLTLSADLTARTPQVVSFDADLSGFPVTKGRVCAAAFVTADGDPITGTDPNLDTALSTNKYVAVRMLRVASAADYFRQAGSLPKWRISPHAALLRNGSVIVACSVNPGGGVVGGDAEIYNAFTNVWSAAAQIQGSQFGWVSAIALNDGRVLLQALSSLATADFYDPTTGSLAAASARHYAALAYNGVLLGDGSILVLGPIAKDVSKAELFHPDTNVWEDIAPPPNIDGMADSTATLLVDGRVLILSGKTDIGGGPAVTIAQLFDPKSRQWTAAPATQLQLSLRAHTATRLPDDFGTVLFIGGLRYINRTPTILNTVIAFNPKTGAWAQMSPMSQPRRSHTATLLDDGTILVAGGASTLGPGLLATVERYDFRSDSWHSAPNMNLARAAHAATKLATGEVLLVGGTGAESETAEIYVPEVD